MHNKRIVIKIGTSSLTYPNGKLNLQRIQRLAWVLTDLRNEGNELVLVSSGAIAVGSDRLGLSERPRDIVGRQAASAVGQAVLMQIYENFFMEYNQKVAQILLTKDVVEDPVRKNHAFNTLKALLDMGVIPIVNENDTVSVDELGFSDNDTLSAYVVTLAKGDLLIILSDIDGLYDADPRKCKEAKLIHSVNPFDPALEQWASGAGTDFGTGGMATKVIAAKMAASQNIPTVVANGEDPAVLFCIIKGEEVGTYFDAAK